MKTYKHFISEIGIVDRIVDPFIPNTLRKFRKSFRSLERMYPGVSQFLSVANRWVLRSKRFENRDLKKLLYRLKRKPDISDMNKTDIKKVYNFIQKYNLQSIQSVRHVFDDYSDFTQRPMTDLQ